ncbi:MAG: hypothetical protein Q8M94_10720, partial [Ignavibacteria bacterium]|nr:hypothetical protein [Ignavibacteria bacterium]
LNHLVSNAFQQTPAHEDKFLFYFDFLSWQIHQSHTIQKQNQNDFQTKNNVNNFYYTLVQQK